MYIIPMIPTRHQATWNFAYIIPAHQIQKIDTGTEITRFKGSQLLSEDDTGLSIPFNTGEPFPASRPPRLASFTAAASLLVLSVFF